MKSKNKSFEAGTLVRFVCAPPRWRGDGPREPGNNLEGQLAVVLEGPLQDMHDWGGVFRVHALTNDQTFDHWGDFMEPVE